MPWDESELWVGEVAADGSLVKTERVAGGSNESIFQPEWSPDGRLHFVSDRNGWWNLYRLLAGGEIEPLVELEAEFGMPQWVFGMSSYAFDSAGRIVCAYYEHGISRLAKIDTRTLKFQPIPTTYTDVTGYGRAYRERLRKKWGVVDVDDCVNGSRYLVERGEVDGNRLMISGGSAGGYTTLCALTFRDNFKAGASHYGVSDAEALARDTHKFESRYLDGLFGPYPEQRDIYYQRSPINFTEQLSCPAIFFQGLEDKVVPPNQAEVMVAALRKKGIPVAYVPFEGEQHGFRQAKNIKRALDGELYFYSRVFRFELADAVEPVEIENL